MKRRELRENIFKLLFVGLFAEREEMPQQLSLYFEDMPQLEDKDRKYMENKVEEALAHAEETDRVLNEISRGWKTSRMNRVDLTILRLAVYEMRYDDSVPVSVAINEAVELGKRFGGDDSGSFINGILGKIAAMDEKERGDVAVSPPEGESDVAKQQPEKELDMAKQQPEGESDDAAFGSPSPDGRG